MTVIAKHPAATDQVVLTDEQRAEFLAVLAAHPGVSHVKTLREIGVVGTAGQIRHAIREQLADDVAATRGDTIRREVLHRAIVGELEDVWHNGEKVGTRVVKSDRLLETAARMWLPEARQQLELTGGGGGPLRVEVDGGRVTGIRDVLELAANILGPGVLEGLGAGAARPALPAVEGVLPDPELGEPAAGAVAAPRPA